VADRRLVVCVLWLSALSLVLSGWNLFALGRSQDSARREVCHGVNRITRGERELWMGVIARAKPASSKVDRLEQKHQIEAFVLDLKSKLAPLPCEQ
jgi:hypothetical protein